MRKTLRTFIVFLFILGSLSIFWIGCHLFFPGPSLAGSWEIIAPEKPDTSRDKLLFILDGSGSMWSRIHGKTKISISQDVMKDIITTLPDSLDTGLIVFGHRRKEDCRDVELVVPVGPLDRKKLFSVLPGIRPKGESPLSNALLLAAEISDKQSQPTIVLLSDGKNTCPNDPCDVIKELKTRIPQLSLYVVGFDVTEREREQLQCLAVHGGGQYIAAQNADELKQALQAGANEAHNWGYIRLIPLDAGKPVPARVTVKEEDREILTARLHDTSTPQYLKLRPSIYTVQLTSASNPGQSVILPDVRVLKQKILSREVDFSRGVLSIQANTKDGRVPAHVFVYEPGGSTPLTSQWARHDQPAKFPLKPGHYRLKVLGGLELQEPVKTLGVDIRAGKTTRQEIYFGQGTLVVTVLQHSRRIDAAVYLYEKNGKQFFAKKWAGNGKPAVFELVPGTYTVKVQMPGAPAGAEKVVQKEVVVQDKKTSPVRIQLQQ